MLSVTTLLLKILPLYFVIFLGFLASKVFKVEKEAIGKLLIYIMAPIIIFYGTFTSELSLSTLSLPILFFLICSTVALLFLFIGGKVYKNDAKKNILAFASGAGNVGYFGLPIMLALFGDIAFSLSIFIILGVIFFENTIGFYIIARGNYSKYESFLKVVKLPSIYAFALGLTFNLLDVELGESIVSTINLFKSSYTLFGMMLVGMGLSKVEFKKSHFKLMSLAFFAKFIVHPLLILFIILLDSNFFHLYNTQIYNVLIVASIVPIAANTVAMASALKVEPEKAALLVFASTVFALIYIPLIVNYLTI